MAEVNQKWMNLVVSGLMRSFGYVVGVEQLKLFVSKAGEAIFDRFEEKGAKCPAGSSITEIVQSTGESIKSMKPSNVEWSVETTENGARLSIVNCPFSLFCSSMLSEVIDSGRLEKEKIPCIMGEIASGACRGLGKKTRSELNSFTPGIKTVVDIIDLEV